MSEPFLETWKPLQYAVERVLYTGLVAAGERPGRGKGQVDENGEPFRLGEDRADLLSLGASQVDGAQQTQLEQRTQRDERSKDVAATNDAYYSGGDWKAAMERRQGSRYDFNGQLLEDWLQQSASSGASSAPLPCPTREELDERHDFGGVLGEDPSCLQVVDLAGQVDLAPGDSGTVTYTTEDDNHFGARFAALDREEAEKIAKIVVEPQGNDSAKMLVNTSDFKNTHNQ